MLLFEQGVALLEFVELTQFPDQPGVQYDLALLATQPSLARFLAPAREHERVNVQSLCDVLDLYPTQLAQLHRAELELQRVAADSTWLCGSSHLTPPSSVRLRCLLFRGKSSVGFSAGLGTVHSPSG